MLKSMKISRFKSIRDLEIDFGRVNLFIGGNGAGKSNLLEAIGLISAALYRGVSETELARKGVRLTPPSLMKSAFKHFDLPKTFRIDTVFQDSVKYSVDISSGERNSQLNFVSEKCTFEDRDVFGRSPRGVRVMGVKRPLNNILASRSLWDQTRLAFDYPSKVSEVFGHLSRYAIYSPQTEFLRGQKAGFVDDPPVGLHGEGLPAAVNTMLRKMTGHVRSKRSGNAAYSDLHLIAEALDLVWLPGWTHQVGVGAVDPLLKSNQLASTEGNIIYFLDQYMHEKRNKLSAYDSSEGTLFLLFISVLLGNPESPRVFALDNVDSALNPALTKRLINKIIELSYNCRDADMLSGPKQIFLTSHNPTSLDAFDLFDNDLRVYVLERNAEGHTQAKRLKPRDGWTRDQWLDAVSGKNLSQMWIDGDIGGALGKL